MILASVASVALVVGIAPAALSGERAGEAPLPECDRDRNVDQGEDVEVTGEDWGPESTVTIAFDGDDALARTDDTTDDTLDDDASDDGAVTADVDEDGEFAADFTIPEFAVRGTHSINVTGEDEDGLAATCARIIRLDEHPDTSATTDDSPSGIR